MTVGEYSGQFIWSTPSFFLFLASTLTWYYLYCFFLYRFTCPSKYISHKVLYKSTASRGCWCPRKVCFIYSIPSVPCLSSNTKNISHRISMICKSSFYLFTTICAMPTLQYKESFVPHRVAHWKEQKWCWTNTFINHRDINVWTQWYHGMSVLLLNCVLTILPHHHVCQYVCICTSTVPYMLVSAVSLVLIHTTLLIYMFALFWQYPIFSLFA
jgi:hypothetical protein